VAKATEEAMTEGSTRFALSPTARRLIRSYGVLVLIAIAFLVMAMMVREKPKTVPADSMRLPAAEVARWH
jgi:hypothetical protein